MTALILVMLVLVLLELTLTVSFKSFLVEFTPQACHR
jgi:hypothetical protein